ncbi:MAG: putative secreted protein, SAP56-like [Candidatus Phytoplasma asteris]|uniref:Sequence-variable mosaic (SVM) signal sequence domain-containing protein n=1 Tax='Chrysanthemum coronarium' phytoplasma TaxID=1520703 RepID=A0ABQ0J370_9MOLU|nr:SVM family protein ['Chrysanthemum coronarium' phytoplasma]TKA87956.1 MAG: putative secreted protein, AYWB SAP56-like protein [Periwinkle leaf yellowing phytoplasma]WEX19625.1 MAG: putative secreted protein, SAP56-like [Candidatus Phytoplasma asteris]GAK74037.1 uncharacterized protein OYV_05250 ['Chrysanthemum coronarium' phytoplasma]
MIKLKNKFQIISVFLFTFIGLLFIFNTKCLYALPGITLETQKIRLEERKNELKSQEIVLSREPRNNVNIERLCYVRTEMVKIDMEIYMIMQQIQMRDIIQ